MIYIDFLAGSHGNYLEFVVNKLHGSFTQIPLPFDSDGAAHNKQYRGEVFCKSAHYTFGDESDVLTNASVVSIKIGIDDLLPFSLISLLRAGNYNYDINELHNNTYNKFNNINYCSVNETIYNTYFLKQLITDYNNVKAYDWPDITNFDDFDLLPEQIRLECMNVFGVGLKRYDTEHPDCPKHILYDFYYHGFLNPENHGFMIWQREKAIYDHVADIYYFNYDSFYDEHKFLNEVANLANWIGIKSYDIEYLKYLHSEFLKRQIYKDTKIRSDAIFNSIIAGENVDISGLTLMEHAYLDAKLTTCGNERFFTHIYTAN